MAGNLPDGCMWPSDADYYEYLNAINRWRELEAEEDLDSLEEMQIEEIEHTHFWVIGIAWNGMRTYRTFAPVEHCLNCGQRRDSIAVNLDFEIPF